jgi:hypothetical protein
LTAISPLAIRVYSSYIHPLLFYFVLMLSFGVCTRFVPQFDNRLKIIYSYILYWKVTTLRYMHLPSRVHSFSLYFICLLLLFEVYHAKGVAFSSLFFATNLLLNPVFGIYFVLAARLWALMIRYDTY